MASVTNTFNKLHYVLNALDIDCQFSCYEDCFLLWDKTWGLLKLYQLKHSKSYELRHAVTQISMEFDSNHDPVHMIELFRHGMKETLYSKCLKPKG